MNQFQTLKSDLTQSRIIDIDSPAIDDGEIAVRIESYAFTANNVTYGVAGDTIGYWKFFPAGLDEKNEWGCIPMWGFAEITHSKIEGLNLGERLFGYFPAADSLILSPIKIFDQSFSDGKEHRKELPPVYNNYVRLAGDQNYDSSMDAVRALLFPLHITAFCLCDSLAEDSYLGASQIIIVSASSKTAIGLAQGLAGTDNPPKIVGLTSAGNAKFVESLGCYDEVISYDELSTVDYSAASVMVDMAGNREILGTLHGELGDNMLKCLTVGMTHWDNETTAEDALGEAMLRDRTEFFFAPAHIQKRIGDWGHDRYAEKTNAFMTARALQSKDWMQVKEISGLENFTSTYEDVVAGKINPNEGIIVNLKK
ncbi:DUF2855 family protein [Gammaproteobacteria bacterium]|nr:DUF2855 family protein [Gammaproteobacteria bacterium]